MKMRLVIRLHLVFLPLLIHVMDMPQTWFLVPGFGSQGGTAQDVAPAFDQRGLGAVVNNSRGIIFAHRREEYRERFGEARWQEAVEAATIEMITQLRAMYQVDSTVTDEHMRFSAQTAVAYIAFVPPTSSLPTQPSHSSWSAPRPRSSSAASRTATTPI